MKTKRKAIALISGGLDSMLAAKMILDQGIHVEGINFFTGFCGDGCSAVPQRKDQDCGENINATWVADKLGIKLNIVDVFEDYKNVVTHPKYGYGSHLNPCLDCKIFMIGQTKKWLEQNGFDFIITGEVIGQRPKSQLKHHLPTVVKDSGIGEILLRPLCAKLLAPTLPEREDWVKRELLENCSGRGRSKQIAMAKKFGFDQFAQPSGGCCFLINKHYTNRLIDLWKTRSNQDYTLNDIALLKVGRHLRPQPHFKMIIGREEAENVFLQQYQTCYASLKSLNHPGPTVLIDGELKDDSDIELAARITARYCSRHQDQLKQISLSTTTGKERLLNVLPWDNEERLLMWHI